MLVIRVVHMYKIEIYIQLNPPHIRLDIGLDNPIQDRLEKM